MVSEEKDLIEQLSERNKRVAQLLGKVEKLQAENEKQKKALGFYGDWDNWTRTEEVLNGARQSLVFIDAGEKAKEALKK